MGHKKNVAEKTLLRLSFAIDEAKGASVIHLITGR